jgi:hypothetical protein
LTDVPPGRSLAGVATAEHLDDVGRRDAALREEHQGVVDQVGGLSGERITSG